MILLITFFGFLYHFFSPTSSLSALPSERPPSPPSETGFTDALPPAQKFDQDFPAKSVEGGYLTIFLQYLEKSNRRLEWRFELESDKTNHAQIWVARAFVTEQEIGIGKGVTRKQAREAAAKAAAKELNLG